MHRHAPAGVRTVPKKSVQGVLHYLTAGYVMTTFAVYGESRPPRSQALVNLWHGEAPSGKVIARFFPGRGGLSCTYRPVTSTVGRAFRATEFGVHPLRVPVVGAARNDRMLRADAQGVRRALLGEAADHLSRVGPRNHQHQSPAAASAWSPSRTGCRVPSSVTSTA